MSARIDEIVFQTLEKERELRQQSAEEVKTDVTRAANAVGNFTAPEKQRLQPAKLTLWCLELMLGGLVSVVVGFALIQYAAMSGVIWRFSEIQTDMGVSLDSSAAKVTIGWLFVSGGAFSAVIGYAGACYSLWQMKRGLIPPVWRRGLRGLVWGPPALIVFGVIAGAVIYFLRGGSISKRAEELERAEVAKAAAVEAARSKIVPTAEKPDPALAISVEEVFRKMNAAANESNGGEFWKLWGTGGTRAPELVTIETFFGKLEVLNARPSPQTTGLTNVYAALRKPDSSMSYQVFFFKYRSYQKKWECGGGESAPFRAACRVEFRPDKGGAEAILRTHLSGFGFRGETTFQPVKDAPRRFDIFGFDLSAEPAEMRANTVAKSLADSLSKFGFGESFKILTPAQKPEKPWLGEESTVTTSDATVHPARWTHVLRARSDGAEARLRADDQSLGLRETALLRVEAPKLRRSSFQRSRDDEEIVAAMPAGERVFFGERCGGAQYGAGVDLGGDEQSRGFVRLVTGEPRRPLQRACFTAKHEQSKRIREFKVVEQLDAQWLRRGNAVRPRFFAQGFLAVVGKEEVDIRADHRGGHRLIRAAHVLIKFLHLCLGHVEFPSGRAFEDRALTPVHLLFLGLPLR